MRFEDLIGKRVLVGITFVSADDEVLDQQQFAGTVASADPEDGVELRLDDGSSRRLPPDLDAFEAAAPGDYRLRSTGEVVTDPDFVSTWTVQDADE
jgi:hypothetical protein